MLKKTSYAALLVAVLAAFSVSAAFAAGPPETTDGFVCPVLGGQAGQNGSAGVFVQIGGGDYSVIGPDVSVPVHATNGDGAGTPPGPHSSPGDTDYTAIWAGE